MNQDLFDALERTFRAEGPDAGFDLLIHALQEQKNYALVFEARQMQKRHAMGLPLIFAGTIADLPPEQQSRYEEALTAAAREAGHSYLAGGDIVNAWTYFRAIGEPGPVAAAIERVQSDEGIEAVLAIALMEGVNPRKGFELLLEHRGICDGISFTTQSADRETRVMFLQMLVKAFYGQLMAHLKEAIARVEGQIPEANRVVELITGRDWLFDGGGFYIENSHLVSILQASPELDDPETMRLVIELADYGRRLAPIHHFRGEPPFEDPYVDYAEYLHALLGEHVEQSVDHFRRKVAESVRGAPDVLVGLLGRLGRYDEAIKLSLEHLGGAAGNGCLSAIQLCQLAGNYKQLCDVARTERDLLGFAAGMVQS
jgi:hypothetical protein